MSTDPGDTTGFDDLGLRPEILTSLIELGYEEATPIQRESIPPICDGRDLLGQAATGTGKTAAFALPILQRLEVPRRSGDPIALVLVPTRELAMQVSEAIHKYGRRLGARVLPIFGGQPIGRQLAALHRGVDIVVATPGRAIDHIGRGTLPLGEISLVVLDEADEMLDMGFAEDIESILESTPDGHQTVLFSATLPSRITKMARRHLTDPIQIQISPSAGENTASAHIRQTAYVVPRAHKSAALGRVLDVEAPDAAIVFCRTRHEVDELTETLNGRGYRAEALHGGMDQSQRDRVMGRVRNRTADLLIATDVAARGLDIDHLTHVINYNVPSAPESYVHRIGRVGRAGRDGVAITLAEPREHRMLKNIERLTKRAIKIEKVPTVADLRTRRLEMMTATLREVLVDGDLEEFRVVVETLADEFDVVEVALAAVKMSHQATGGMSDEDDIPEVAAKPRQTDRDRPSDRTGSYDRNRHSGSDRSTGHDRSTGGSKRFDKNRDAAPSRDRSHGKRPSEDMTRLYVGVGRRGGIRPADLVGAIAGETSLSGRDIGAIQISDHFSIVEVPERAVNEVIGAIKNTTIKGKRAKARRDRSDHT